MASRATPAAVRRRPRPRAPERPARRRPRSGSARAPDAVRRRARRARSCTGSNGGPARSRPSRRPGRSSGACGARPTLVQNVETLAHIGAHRPLRPDWFRALGTAAEPGSMLVTVGGAVHAPACTRSRSAPRSATILAAGGAVTGPIGGRPGRRLLRHLAREPGRAGPAVLAGRAGRGRGVAGRGRDPGAAGRLLRAGRDRPRRRATSRARAPASAGRAARPRRAGRRRSPARARPRRAGRAARISRS